MMKSLALIGLLAVAVPSAAGAQTSSAEPKAILPGYWSYSASSILPGASEGHQCVLPDKIDEFMSGPHNRHYKCTYPNKFVGQGRAQFDGECVSKRGDRYKLTVAGTYSPTRFTLSGHIQGSILGLPLTAPISIDARWLAAECPEGLKPDGAK